MQQLSNYPIQSKTDSAFHHLEHKPEMYPYASVIQPKYEAQRTMSTAPNPSQYNLKTAPSYYTYNNYAAMNNNKPHPDYNMNTQSLQLNRPLKQVG